MKYTHELLDDKSLVIIDAGHSSNYYGLHQKWNKHSKDIKEKANTIEEALKKIDESTVQFYNITSDGSIRYGCNYNYNSDNPPFIGVSYISKENFIKEYDAMDI